MYYYIKYKRTPKKAETFSLSQGFYFVKANSPKEAEKKVKNKVMSEKPNTAEVEIISNTETGYNEKNPNWGNILDKSPLSFMDSVVRAFKDKPFDDYIWLITYQTDFVGKKNFYSKKETKEQAINELKNELIRQGSEKGLKIFSIKKNASEILRRQAGQLGSALQKPKTKKWELYVYNKQNNRHIGIYTIEADTPKTAVEILKKGKRKIMNIEPKDWLIKVNK